MVRSSVFFFQFLAFEVMFSKTNVQNLNSVLKSVPLVNLILLNSFGSSYFQCVINMFRVSKVHSFELPVLDSAVRDFSVANFNSLIVPFQISKMLVRT